MTADPLANLSFSLGGGFGLSGANVEEGSDLLQEQYCNRLASLGCRGWPLLSELVHMCIKRNRHEWAAHNEGVSNLSKQRASLLSFRL